MGVAVVGVVASWFCYLFGEFDIICDYYEEFSAIK